MTRRPVSSRIARSMPEAPRVPAGSSRRPNASIAEPSSAPADHAGGLIITPLSADVGCSDFLNRYAHFSKRGPLESITAKSDPSYAQAPAYSPFLLTA